MNVQPRHDRRLLFGFQLDPLTLDEVVRRCSVAIALRQPMLIGVLNAAKIVKARRDDLLLHSLLDCNLLLADGQAVVWASRLLKRPLPERVAGIDLFEKLLALADREERSIYLLGAKPEVLGAVKEAVRQRFPGARIAGSHHGYFAEDDSEEIAREIGASDADMLFLGMTSPRKEIFVAKFGPALNVSVVHGVGGSFDIMAGQTKRAPVAWQRAGMEWAYRVVQEPRRMWWRYLSTNTSFILLTIGELLRPAHPFEGAGSGSAASGIRHI
ncbi:WecB/TagA/CpsF family glycosyltransferase [Aquamicrobium zhengzhouense]|uniref:WecB/TagA/CpsF family glycosyltransferase n=1 Tax=Aquamicrobium zhengzhouense TaxID=2781738 RepID=A0ABS0S7J5_9HYPH|nr:WecB/TagA/CpsF family glycosyltransferase [Aquamicrobium zhengzhouense]MBI1619237.1 WecB/TagA/CpsF family glycosyltransferase [Aquamicrobium zhengzhouense]